jgi:hypothetical protein
MPQIIKVPDWGPACRVAVMLARSLGGHASDTWRRGSDGQSFWPPWLTKDIPGLAGWVLAYDATTTN